jgi:hypothetical protein
MAVEAGDVDVALAVAVEEKDDTGDVIDGEVGVAVVTSAFDLWLQVNFWTFGFVALVRTSSSNSALRAPLQHSRLW